MTARATEAMQTLLSLLEKIAEERKYVDYSTVVEELSDAGVCITSVVFLATLRANAKPDLKLFGKVAAMSVESRKPLMRCVFSSELYFYTKVKKQFERIQDKHNVRLEHRLFLPKLYGSRDDYLFETLVLDDLSAQGFHTFDIEHRPDLEYVSAAIEVMAKYHALSLAYHHDDPEDFKKTLEALKMDVSKAEAMIILMKPKLLASAFASTEKHRGRLKKYFAQEPCPILLFLEFYRSKNRNILVHGDFKTSNLMHRRRNGKLEIVLVDFQLTRAGDPLVDLLYFLFTATDEGFRRAHYHDILHQYYVQLRTALHRLHLDAAVVYPEDTYTEVLKELETKAGPSLSTVSTRHIIGSSGDLTHHQEHNTTLRCSMWGLSMAVILLPMILVEQDKVPAFDEEYDVTDLVMETSAVYRRVFNGVLDNYVEWGLL